MLENLEKLIKKVNKGEIVIDDSDVSFTVCDMVDGGDIIKCDLVNIKYTEDELNELYKKYDGKYKNIFLQHCFKLQNLSEDFIENYIDTFDEDTICEMFGYKKLSENFIEKYSEKYSERIWSQIFHFQNLSENFIDKNEDKIKDDIFDFITYTQKNLSENFIKKYSDKINWIYMIKNNSLSTKFIEENLYKFNLYAADKHTGINDITIKKLIKKYPEKYEVDKIQYELN